MEMTMRQSKAMQKDHNQNNKHYERVDGQIHCNASIMGNVGNYFI